MWQNLIGDQIRRANRNLFVVNSALLLLVAALVAGNWRYLSNVLRGPVSIDPAALVRIQNPDRLERYYFEVAGLQPRVTGISYVKREHGTERTEWVLLAAKVQDRYLLIKARREVGEASYSGYLQKPESQLGLKLMEQFPRAEFDQTFYPYLLDATNFGVDAVLGMIAGAALALFALFNLSRCFLRSQDYSRSPIYKQLARFGGVPETVALAIDGEFQQSPASLLSGTWFTRSWFLHRTQFGFDAVPLRDILWAYQRVVTHYQYFIPVAKSRQLVVHDRFGKKFSCGGREKSIGAALGYLVQRLPWIPCGYSADLAASLRHDPASFGLFIDQRRSEFYARLNTEERQTASI